MIRMLGLLLALSGLFTAPLTDSEPITVGETQLTNSYPESVTFEVEAASSVGEITSVDINLAIRGASSTLTEKPLEIGPALLGKWIDF